MNNWQKTITKLNTERYKIPAGWDTKDQVALSLECDPSKVHEIMKPGISSGHIERREFPVWDESRRMAVRVPCYRLVEPRQEKEETAIETQIREAILKDPSRSDINIRKKIKGSTVAIVKKVRSSL